VQALCFHSNCPSNTFLVAKVDEISNMFSHRLIAFPCQIIRVKLSVILYANYDIKSVCKCNANCANGKEDSEVMTIHITKVTDS